MGSPYIRNMISYNPKNWSGFLLDFRRIDTIRKLQVPILIMIVYSAFVAYLEMDYFRLSPNSSVKNISLLHTLLGFAISMLLVFRTNTAYDRWWEGRRLWGSLVNNSRNLAMKLNVILGAGQTSHREFFRQILPQFSHELMVHLQSEETRFELDENPHPEIPDFDRSLHIPNQIAGLITGRVYQLYREGLIKQEELLLLNTELSSFLEITGACERIKNTPIPYSYSSFIKKFIFFYILTLPIGYVFSLGYLVIPVGVFVFYVLASLELIAEEIEEPFGKDSNDLPMARITNTIRKSVGEILG